MTSSMFAWTKNDFVRSLTTSVFVAIVAVLYGLTVQQDFNLFTADWGSIWQLVINSAFITFMARMSEKFLSNKDGKVFGRIG